VDENEPSKQLETLWLALKKKGFRIKGNVNDRKAETMWQKGSDRPSCNWCVHCEEQPSYTTAYTRKLYCKKIRTRTLATAICTRFESRWEGERVVIVRWTDKEQP
jgi:hypothetical protein